MEKLLIFTDIHITSEGEDIIGLDPLQNFSDGLSHALTHHPDAKQIILTGDLVHRGRADEYARLRHALRDCPLPVAMTIGNHDDRDRFRQTFPEVPVDEAGFVQSVIDLPHHRLILLDTVDADAEIAHSGVLCETRLAWLERQLHDTPNTPTLLFMHHPPLTTGFDGMDHIGLRNRAEIGTRLSAYPQIKQIVAGHVHRTIFGTAGGIPVAIFKSPCHQMPMVLGDAQHDLSVAEPGAYGILLLHDDGVIVHSEDFGLT